MTDAATADMTGDIIDAVTTYQTPESYLIGTVLLGLLFGLLMVLKYGKVPYNDYLKENGLTASEVRYGMDFLSGNILCLALSGLLGFAVPGWALGLMGATDAPAILYYVIAAFTGIIVGRYGVPLTNAICDVFRDRVKIASPGTAQETTTTVKKE